MDRLNYTCVFFFGDVTKVTKANIYWRCLFLQPAVYFPVKSTRVVPPSPQKTELPQPRPTQVVPSPMSSPLKISSSTQPSSPLKSSTATSSPHRGHIPQSPLKNQGPSNKLISGPALNSSPSKPLLTPKPDVVPQSRERFTKDTTPLQQRGPAGTSGQ